MSMKRKLQDIFLSPTVGFFSPTGSDVTLDKVLRPLQVILSDQLYRGLYQELKEYNECLNKK